jgi:acyl carrier protein
MPAADQSPAVRHAVRDFIQENYLLDGSNDLSDEDSLLERQVMDSTGVLELVSFLEETFGVKVEDDELVPENLDSIARIAQFVRQKRSA